jgi:hypothetical protein
VGVPSFREYRQFNLNDPSDIANWNMMVERLADIGRKMGQLPPLLSLRLLSDQNVSPSDECAPARLSRGSTSKVGGMKLATLGER